MKKSKLKRFWLEALEMVKSLDRQVRHLDCVNAKLGDTNTELGDALAKALTELVELKKAQLKHTIEVKMNPNV